jgi:penicillin-insensitive murein endopeptidase
MAAVVRCLSARYSKLLLFIVSMVTVVLCLDACGSHSPVTGSFDVSPEFKKRHLPKPTQVLSPTASTKAPAPKGPYEPIKAVVTAKMKPSPVMTAIVQMKSSAGIEVVNLAGAIRADHTATLSDLHPVGGENCVYAEAWCDAGTCEKVITNVYYKVNGITLHKQFGSDSLLVSSVDEAQEMAQTDVKLDGDSDEPGDSDAVNPNELGEFVGPARNETMIGKLVDRPINPAQGTCGTQKPDAAVSAAIQPAQAAAVVAPPVAPPPAKAPAPAAPAAAPSKFSWTKMWNDVIKFIHPKKAQVAPAAPAKPAPLAAAAPSSQPQDDIGETELTEDTTPDSQMEVPDAPPTEEVANQVGEVQAQVGPLLGDLSSGGRAEGCYSRIRSDDPGKACEGGRLINGQKIPESGAGFRLVHVNPGVDFATGMMWTLLQKAADVMTNRIFPGAELVIGNVAKQQGGAVAGQASHQNGLDADIFYFGLTSPGSESAIDSRGQVNEELSMEKNWAFWQLIQKQEIIQDAKKYTVLNRIFVNSAIKHALCSWASRTHKLDDNLDPRELASNKDVLRRIRPTPSPPGSHVDSGHKKHFHVRLHCSPFYPDCRNQIDPDDDTGC